jgi:hypothetical protein
VLPDRLQRLFRAARAAYVMATALEQLKGELPVRLLVVDNKYLCHK